MPDRNPNATWETCPFYHPGSDSVLPHCRKKSVELIQGGVAMSKQQGMGNEARYSGAFPTTPDDCWCGDHPDIFTGGT